MMMTIVIFDMFIYYLTKAVHHTLKWVGTHGGAIFGKFPKGAETRPRHQFKGGGGSVPPVPPKSNVYCPPR